MVNGLNNYGTRLGAPNNKSQVALPDLSIGSVYGSNSRSNSNLKSLKQQKVIYTKQPQVRQRNSRNPGLTQSTTGEKMGSNQKKKWPKSRRTSDNSEQRRQPKKISQKIKLFSLKVLIKSFLTILISFGFILESCFLYSFRIAFVDFSRSESELLSLMEDTEALRVLVEPSE